MKDFQLSGYLNNTFLHFFGGSFLPTGSGCGSSRPNRWVRADPYPEHWHRLNFSRLLSETRRSPDHSQTFCKHLYIYFTAIQYAETFIYVCHINIHLIGTWIIYKAPNKICEEMWGNSKKPTRIFTWNCYIFFFLKFASFRSNIFPHSAMPLGKQSKADTMTKSLSLLLNKVRLYPYSNQKCCGSASVSMRTRIWIQLYISVRILIRIQVWAKPMRTRNPVRL